MYGRQQQRCQSSRCGVVHSTSQDHASTYNVYIHVRRYWANGNVPLVSLLRTAGALHRLPKDLPLDVVSQVVLDNTRFAFTNFEKTIGIDGRHIRTAL